MTCFVLENITTVVKNANTATARKQIIIGFRAAQNKGVGINIENSNMKQLKETNCGT